ncbi:Signal-transduction histidine kinase senX3 [Polystyrenella longa]|uniref:histidine kinase n=1 Tax=Polystyrenella longa TaxID=2528007 RepID=A0A518CL26_9PLAN|nr:HAMP domain-containing sensor histidine kinase [Polystyrenella longa]QDU79931.1 Signal-transduction histidine kinase senX3 [Polystyrenella longa]
MSLSADTLSTASSNTTETSLVNRLSQRYWQLMPTLDFPNALQRVVEIWWEETTSHAVLLITPSPGEQSLWFHFYDQQRSIVELGTKFPCDSDWAENFLALVEQQWGEFFPASDLHQLQFIPLHISGPVRGMLACAIPVSSLSDDFEKAAEVTCRFLEQVRLAHRPASLVQLQELKLQSLAEFAAGAGHEINNPLATISGRAQLLLKNEADPERREMLTNIGAQALRIRDMIGDLMLFGRPPVPQFESVPLREVFDDVIRKLKARFGNEISFEIASSEDYFLLADRTQLEQVVCSLLENGLIHSPDDTEKILRIEYRPGYEGRVQIEITSPGSSLSDLNQLHMFDPFYSGQQAGRGLGFGLSKAWQIARLHDATIAVSSHPSQGTKVTVHWPKASEKTTHQPI